MAKRKSSRRKKPGKNDPLTPRETRQLNGLLQKIADGGELTNIDRTAFVRLLKRPVKVTPYENGNPIE